MLIEKAQAQAAGTAITASQILDAPSPGEIMLKNLGFVAVLVGLFYVLLILPQQRRFREHSKILSGLKKGDKVLTGGGLVGVIDKISEDSDEVIVDLGGGMKVTALRSTLSTRSDARLKGKPGRKAPDKAGTASGS